MLYDKGEGCGVENADVPLVRVRARPQVRSMPVKLSSNLSIESRVSRKRSSGFRTFAKALRRVSDILSKSVGAGSGPGGWAICWCILTF